jgi:hypothetical protein
MRDTLGGDLATVPGHKARRRQGAAAVPPHQIVSPSLSQSESPVAVDLRIHARNDGQPLAQAPMVHAGHPAVRRDRAGLANTILGLVRIEAGDELSLA